MNIGFLNVTNLLQYLPGQIGIFLDKTDQIVAPFQKPHPDFYIGPLEMPDNGMVLNIFGVKLKHNYNKRCEFLFIFCLVFPHI